MGKNGNFRLTRLERNWILYDVGNSAFVLMVATLIPIFFNALAESGGLTSVEYLAYWGYASSVVTIIIIIFFMLSYKQDYQHTTFTKILRLLFVVIWIGSYF